MKDKLPQEYMDRLVPVLQKKYEDPPTELLVPAMKVSVRAGILVGKAWMEAKDLGFSLGHQNGYYEGERVGENNGYARGYDDGHSEGYSQGKSHSNSNSPEW